MFGSLIRLFFELFLRVCFDLKISFQARYKGKNLQQNVLTNILLHSEMQNHGLILIMTLKFLIY